MLYPFVLLMKQVSSMLRKKRASKTNDVVLRGHRDCLLLVTFSYSSVAAQTEQGRTPGAGGNGPGDQNQLDAELTGMDRIAMGMLGSKSSLTAWCSSGHPATVRSRVTFLKYEFQKLFDNVIALSLLLTRRYLGLQ